MTTPIMLRIDALGRIQAVGEGAGNLLGSTLGRPCRNVVAARDPGGELVCSQACVPSLFDGGTPPDGFVMVRGIPHRIRCNRVGDEVVVLLEAGRVGSGYAEPLTPRECEVLASIAEGLTSREVGAALGISVGTVRTHTERARRKLGANTRAQAVCIATTLGLIP